MSNDLQFSHDLIKGKIAETIFEQMFRRNGKYTILKFGYEYTASILAQYQHSIELQKVLKNIRHAPDFILLSEDKKEVYLVEVKYRSSLHLDQIKKIAQDTLEVWDPSFLFVATPKGFLFEPCHTIVNKDGFIESLHEKWASHEIQKEYLNLLNEYIPGHLNDK